MKKKYERPFVYIEQFRANQFIAGCNLVITYDKLDTMSCINPLHLFSWQHSVKDGKVNNVFTDLSRNCVTIINNGSPYSDVYNSNEGDDWSNSRNGFMLGTTVYGLSEEGQDSAGKEVRYIHSYDVNECYGGFQNRTNSETFVEPYS